MLLCVFRYGNVELACYYINLKIFGILKYLGGVDYEHGNHYWGWSCLSEMSDKNCQMLKSKKEN